MFWVDRLSEATIETVEVGQRGEDDEALQFSIMRAEEGDMPSILLLGDMLYWGKRGLGRYGKEPPQSSSLEHHRARWLHELAFSCQCTGRWTTDSLLSTMGWLVGRDHPRALRLFDRAVAVGDQHAMCLAAGMYLKGEGGEKNTTRGRSVR